MPDDRRVNGCRERKQHHKRRLAKLCTLTVGELNQTRFQGRGIENVRPGRHILRDKKRWRIGALKVSHAWHASILPSFHDRAVVAVARAHDTEYRGTTFPGRPPCLVQQAAA
jgi:hypothetical protein